MTAIIPYAPEQRAVAQSIASVIYKKQTGKRRCDNPYAKYFFKYYLNTTKPSKILLSQFVSNTSLTIPKITKNVNDFICSNGTRYWLVERNFALKCFPAIKHMQESRLEGRIDMQFERDNKIQVKNQLSKNAMIQSKQAEILKLDNRSLPKFVADNSDDLTELELMNLLRGWYAENDDSGYSFTDLYSGYTASRIALDLSW